MGQLAQQGVIAGRYRITRAIGGGGFGRVYAAEHVVTGRRCALKVMLAQLDDGDASRQRFLRESQLASQIRSEFTADILDAGIDSATGSTFIAMELLEGEDLGRRATRLGSFTPGETLYYLSHAAAALAAAHALGIVHRDLKPSNLFLTRRRDGKALVKVLDFGIAKQLENADSALTTAAVGTPIYMAPEQFRNVPVSAAVDVHALGMLAFRFLVGQHYFELERRESGNNFALGALLMRGTQEAASARAARYGQACEPGFDAWFARATHVEPGRRFSSAEEAIAELARCLNLDLDTLAPEFEVAEPAPQPAAEHDTSTDSLHAEIHDLPTTQSPLSAAPPPIVQSPRRAPRVVVAALVGVAFLFLIVFTLRQPRHVAQGPASGTTAGVDAPRASAQLTRAPAPAPNGSDRERAALAESKSSEKPALVVPTPAGRHAPRPPALPARAASAAPAESSKPSARDLWTRE